MTIKYFAVDNLLEYENNPRINDGAVEAVAKSIENFGFKVPIVIDKDNVIIAGHTRLKAAKLLGMEKVPVIVADDLTPEQVKAFRLVDNKTAELAEWDMELLESEIADIDNIDMQAFGFEIDGFDIENETFEDEAPERDDETEPTTQLGDVWQLGRHRLICGDSTDEKAVKKLMNGKTADLALTDPPYNVNYEGKQESRLTIANDNMESKEFYNFLYAAFVQIYNNLKAGSVAYICHAHMESINFMSAYKAAGFKLAEMLVWNKNVMALGRSDYQWKHEPIIYGWKEGAAHYFIDDRTQTTVFEDKPNYNKMTKAQLIDLCKQLAEPACSTTIINEDKPAANSEHPTMKPIKLLARMIKNSSKKGELVIDFFGGSGSTLIACEQLERTCYTMELDPKYCDVIVKRWEALTGEQAQLIK